MWRVAIRAMRGEPTVVMVSNAFVGLPKKSQNVMSSLSKLSMSSDDDENAWEGEEHVDDDTPHDCRSLS